MCTELQIYTLSDQKSERSVVRAWESVLMVLMEALSLVASPVGCQSEVKIIFIVIHSCIMHATKNK